MKFVKHALVYLGHIVSSEGLKLMPDKLEKIRFYPKPNDVKALQRFLSLCNYYNRFTLNFSKKASPLFSLLHGQKKKGYQFQWNLKADDAFFDLIEEMTTGNLCLQFPDFAKEFTLHTDASEYAIGAVLSQKTRRTRYDRFCLLVGL